MDMSGPRNRLRAITGARWERRGGDVYLADESEPLFHGRETRPVAQAEADAEFVAHAPQDMAALLTEVVVLTAEVDRLRRRVRILDAGDAGGAGAAGEPPNDHQTVQNSTSGGQP